MRKDYDYVDKATSLCLKTTDEGSKVIKEVINTNIDELVKGGKYDLLGAIDEDYYFVPDEGGMKEWYKSYLIQYKKGVGVDSPTTWEEFKKAFEDGLITIHKVIWD